VSRALSEALGALASDALATDILMNALADAGHASPPEDAEDLDAFVRGALADEVSAVLGPQAAEAILASLAPIVATMKRAEQEPTGPQPIQPSRATPRPERRDPSDDGVVDVVLVSSDPVLVALARARFPSLRVLVPPAVLSGRSRVVLLDLRGRRALATRWGAAALTRVVVLWPGRPNEHDLPLPPGARALHVREEAEVDDVLLLVGVQLG
jgi:hypothetical protein